ncbi:MAG TPA: plastocyanin/azurin family copper-binding protein [Acidimicrobiales bacterium]|nr:plastocyanin/azurin family copper-binding protein [Acidimicrobiales bacterium]
MRRLLLAALPLALVLAACGGDDDSGAPTEPGVVLVDDNVFRPKTITVSAGDTVTWRWVGNNAHNVVADDFSSDLQKEGEFEHTFEDAGRYNYHCTVHPGMNGTVEVTP